MKNYDFKKAKRLIEENQDLIQDAALGMHEDWFWTGQEVFNAEEGFTMDLDSVEKIAGISGSSWATPCLRVTLRSGEDKCVACFADDGAPASGGNPFGLGPLSGPAQINIPGVEEDLVK